MFKGKLFKSKFLNLGLVCVFILLFFPVETLSQDSPVTGSLVGFIYMDDLKTPIKNAIVYIRNIDNQLEYASTPTDEIGLYTIKDIEEGRYVLGVSSEAGNFNFSYSVLIKANEIAKLSIAPKPGGTLASGQGGTAVGEGTLASGQGGALVGGTAGGFFTSTAGTLLLITAAGGLIFGSYKLLEQKEEASLSTKK